MSVLYGIVYWLAWTTGSTMACSLLYLGLALLNDKRAA